MNEKKRNRVRPKLPPWIRVKISSGGAREKVNTLLDGLKLNTVCRSAACPNLGECWNRQTATFMILGNECTRNCRFCGVHHSEHPSHPDPEEPDKIAKASKELGLKYVVLTSVTRDDLPDGGAAHFALSIKALRKAIKGVKVEVLTPDFKTDRENIKTVLDSGPDVFNHNIETVERFSDDIRSGAGYRSSLKVLKTASELSGGKIIIKSGLMVGLGETDEEVEKTIHDLREAGVEMLTIGQYLPPTNESWPLDRYVEPEKFNYWKSFAENLGFSQVASGPLVRSSYHAESSWKESGDQ